MTPTPPQNQIKSRTHKTATKQTKKKKKERKKIQSDLWNINGNVYNGTSKAFVIHKNGSAPWGR